jgi:hypothetical protein
VALAAALAIGAGSASARLPGRDCGSIHVRAFNGPLYRYTIRVISGHPGCTTAKTVLGNFMRVQKTARGWACFRGHALQGQNWAAACATKSGVSTIHAYLITRA